MRVRVRVRVRVRAALTQVARRNYPPGARLGRGRVRVGLGL